MSIVLTVPSPTCPVLSTEWLALACYPSKARLLAKEPGRSVGRAAARLEGLREGVANRASNPHIRLSGYQQRRAKRLPPPLLPSYQRPRRSQELLTPPRLLHTSTHPLLSLCPRSLRQRHSLRHRNPPQQPQETEQPPAWIPSVRRRGNEPPSGGANSTHAPPPRGCHLRAS